MPGLNEWPGPLFKTAVGARGLPMATDQSTRPSAAPIISAMIAKTTNQLTDEENLGRGGRIWPASAETGIVMDPPILAGEASTLVVVSR